MRHRATWLLASLLLMAVGCGGGTDEDAGTGLDAGRADAGTVAGDAGDPTEDAGRTSEDAGTTDEDAGAAADAGGATDAGAGADAGPTGDGGAADCAQCVGATLTWGYEGGLRISTSTGRIDPCRDFVYERTTFGSGGGTVESCTNEVPCAGDAITIGDVLAALADSDVQTAFASAPILYGRDTRPSDGVVFEIEQGGRTVTVGSPCSGTSSCRPIPAGVAALRDLLVALENERLAEEPCASTFPGS